jgi:ferrous iron transport protein A
MRAIRIIKRRVWDVLPEKVSAEMKNTSTLADLRPGERGIIEGLNVGPDLKHKLNALGVVKGIEIVLEFAAPMGDPRAYSLLGYNLSLRNEDARKIILRAAV